MPTKSSETIIGVVFAFFGVNFLVTGLLQVFSQFVPLPYRRLMPTSDKPIEWFFYIGGGCLFLIVGLISLYKVRRNTRLQKLVAENGVDIQGEVIAHKLVPPYRVSGVWYLAAIVVRGEDGRTYQSLGADGFELKKNFPIGSIITVRTVPDNPKAYWIDLYQQRKEHDNQ